MGKQLTVGKRIALGFSFVILITIVLGGLATRNMYVAQVNSAKLSDEYVPEVDVAAKLRGAANRVMYEMRGYGFTEEDQYYQNAAKELAAVETALQECRELDARAVHLTQLAGQIKVAEEAVTDYKQAVAETVKTTGHLADNRAALDSNAAAYMSACEQFVQAQNAAFERDLEERLQKIALVSEIIDTGTKTRVLNFKAQALGEIDLLVEAMETVGGVADTVAELRAITLRAEDLAALDEINDSADVYHTSMVAFGAEFNKGTQADQDRLTVIRQEMDAAAATYVANCESYLNNQMNALRTDMQERHEKTTLANDVVSIGNATRIAAFKSQALRDPEMMESGMENLKQLNGKFLRLREITRLDKDLEAIAATERAGKSYGATMASFLEDWHKLQELGIQRDEDGKIMIAAAKTTADGAITATRTIADESATSLATSTWIIAIGLLIGTAVAICAAFLITRSITKPLNHAVDSLSSGADQVTSAASQVAQSSQSMAEGASNQASSLEEISASLEQITSMTRQNADSSHEANHLASKAQSDAGTGSEAMSRMSTAIDEIKNSADETAGIVKTIEEIAFQTNLLALNAAVEAARAGDAGKGFAVVAEEVRNLAQRAAEAARNTGDLISESVKNAENGVSISREVAESLTKIAEGSTRVEHITAEVAAASKEQAQGVEQISVAMSQIDQVTQRNAADSEEGAAAAEELNAQAGEMMRVVLDVAKLVGGGNGEHDNVDTEDFAMEDAPSDRSYHTFDTFVPTKALGHVTGNGNGNGSHDRNNGHAARPRESVTALTDADMEDF